MEEKLTSTASNADVDVHVHDDNDNKIVSDESRENKAVDADSKATNDTNADSKSTNDDSKPLSKEKSEKSSVFVKIGLIGDASVGKTTLMVKYIENKFDEVYIETLGVNFMEKMVTLKSTDITFSLWDLGGRQEFLTMLPLVCIDAVAFFFIFDLSRKSTLLNIKEWYRQAKGLNKNAHVILIGNKYDLFTTLPTEEQDEITALSKKYAKAMKASLIFSSSPYSINVQKIFKIALAKIFDLKCTLVEIDKVGEPILLFDCK